MILRGERANCHWTVEIGNVLDLLRKMPDDSVHCVTTSPPYFGLRNYGTVPLIWDGDSSCVHEWGENLPGFHPGQVAQTKWKSAAGRTSDAGGNVDSGAFCQKCQAWRGSLGNEPTPKLFVAHLVEIFREVRRVLRPDGTLWLNLGDSYNNRVASRKRGNRDVIENMTNGTPLPSWVESKAEGRTRMSLTNDGLKEKDLLGIPWSVALALRDDGWYLRSDVIWHKNSVMPESVKDRPTKSHEYVFLLTKEPGYFYDHVAVLEPYTTAAKENYPKRAKATGRGSQAYAAARGSDRDKSGGFPSHGGRNRRSVWTVNPKPFRDAHFAVWPPELVQPMIMAGTSERGVCAECGSPYVRVVQKGEKDLEHAKECGADAEGNYTGQATKDYLAAGAQDASATKARILEGMRKKITVGWIPTCKHVDAGVVPAIVLDPFSGSGTSVAVAVKLGRNGIGFELNPKYAEMTEARVLDIAGDGDSNTLF